MFVQLRRELSSMGIDMYVVDGRERPYVYGLERTKLLNRSKVLINVLREEWDDNSMRFVLGAANGALSVSETVWPHSAFEPGVHYISTPAADLAQAVRDAVIHFSGYRAIVDQARALVNESLTMERSVRSLVSGLGNE